MIIAIITIVAAALLMATSVRVVADPEQHRRGARAGRAARRGDRRCCSTPTSRCPCSATPAASQGHGSYLWPFLVVIALVVTQLVGFETAGAFAEETRKSRIKPSQAIIAGLAGTALMLFIFDLALLLAIPDVPKAMAGPSIDPRRAHRGARAAGSPSSSSSARWSRCSAPAIATLATIVRMIYGMARNGQLPGSGFLTRLSPRTDEPLGTIVVAAVLSIIPLIFIKKIPVIVAAITALIIIPYILVLGALLFRRLRRLAARCRPVQPGPLGPADHDRRPGLDRHHPVGRGLAARDHQPRPRVRCR